MVLHTDGAVNPQLRGVGYGAVVTEPDDKLIGALEFFDPVSHSPLAAEVNAMIQGLRLLQRMNISCASICLDSINVVKMINGDIHTTSDVHHWILQIQHMKESFDTLAFTYVSRQCNRQADFLAKEVLSYQRSMIWVGNFPPTLTTIRASSPCNCKMSCLCST